MPTSMTLRFSVLFLVAWCLIAQSVGANKRKVSTPPRMTVESLSEKAYKIGEECSLPCQAVGEPSPTYLWRKNGEPLEGLGFEIYQVPGAGTITIKTPTAVHEGVYQCFASNEWGTALSVKTLLRKAELQPFPTVKEPKVHRAPVGAPLTLHCQPPNSYPTGSVYWGENKNGSKLRPIENTNRVSQDYDGNLHFSNIILTDSLGGSTTPMYLCALFNEPLRSLVQGEDQKIHVIPANPRYEAPKVLWHSNTNDIAVQGSTKKMKCIFSGYPTPDVVWIRLDKAMPEKNKMTSFGQELTIPNADFSVDPGRYQCRANNTMAGSTVTKEFQLSVESPPYWRNEKPPEDVNTSEEDNAEFECHVNGFPKPTITWYINGLPLSESRPNPRRRLIMNTLHFENVTESDAQVIQCNASNAHGYIFANAFLNVLAEKPSFVGTPQKRLKVAIGQTATLTCRVFGAPKPTIIWQKLPGLDDVLYIDNTHFFLLDSGDLEIRNVTREDESDYQCYVNNKFGADAARGGIAVSERTVILDRPKDQTVVAAMNMSFVCNATTDGGELKKLTILWKRSGEPLKAGVSGHVYIRDGGRLLTIQNTSVEDTGSYSCNASNELDWDEVTVQLTVKDRPSPPYNIRLESCGSDMANIAWSPGSENNEPIIGYTVLYNTSYMELGKYQREPRVEPSRNELRVKLQPWTNYTFHVVAENSLGESPRSEYTASFCRTPAAPPQHNPQRVCTVSRNPTELVIVWEPMVREKHYGEGFKYVITYRRADIRGSLNITETVTDWHNSEIVIKNQDTYKEYEFSVQAVNDMGSASGPVNRMLGFSGEDVPLDSPQNFEIENATLNSTSAKFSWIPVDTSLERIRGFFKGYRIQFWKTDEPENIRDEDLILNAWTACRPVPSGKGRNKRSQSSISLSTNRLWPYSTITAGIVVLNGAKHGPISNTVTFTTPEGVPSVVPTFWVSERGSHHLKLSWSPPLELNGIPTGYVIGYKLAPPEKDTLLKTVITNPAQLNKKLHDLKDGMEYVIYIWAMTSAGEGPEMVIKEMTVEEAEPDKPSIDILESGYDFVNVSWLPSGAGPPNDPGCDFIVEYKLDGTDYVNKTPIETEHNWVNVSGLIHGALYEFGVVAMNRKGDSMRSDLKKHKVGVREPQQLVASAASSLWFIVLICILLFLLFVFAIFILMRRNRGENYPVYEKEKLHGNKGTLDEEATFAEYVRQEEPTIKKSQGSLESSGKSEEEDGSDSLGVYEDVDPTKFNDEGSFVDQTKGYKKLEETKVSPDGYSAPPSVLSTII